ncbi:RNA-guided pseudouridylation complex pseudouridine synthase subunit Cbf5 [Haloplanus halobius]|uniref:RNA-guided pseudouridylation complex pseudouridine synthase subunit Cbf5 n=1 Tax=Haloplanus halobius TaxID=2934938 RepID=UPI00200DF9EC
MTLRDPPGTRDLDGLLRFGVLNLDKPPGPSAHQVAGWIRDMADLDRAAHAGTLDPKVTGCLPVMLGDATRLAPVFLEGRKEYVAVLELHGRAPANLDDVVAEFEGEIYQKPPRKSAVARRLRTRTIHGLDVLEQRDRQVLLRIECASGTYVRKLCHDLGLALGTGAHMGDLRRTATDPFDDRDLVTMQDFADALAFAAERDEKPIRAVVDPAERILDGIPSVTIAPSAAEQVATGAPVYAPGVIDSKASPVENGEAPLVACHTPDGSAVCLGRLVGDPEADSGLVVDLERVLV